jgi:single-strand DNA-binding protein
MLIGRLTRKPEAIASRAGETVGAKFGFAVNNRKFNQDTQTWDEVPVYLDVEIWNRGENKQAERVLKTLRGPDREAGIKASQVFLEGHLRMDEWTDRDTQKKRTKIVVVVDSFQYLDARQDFGGGGMEGDEGTSRAPRQAAPARAPRPAPAPARNAAAEEFVEDNFEDEPASPPRGGAPRGGSAPNEDDIPF